MGILERLWKVARAADRRRWVGVYGEWRAAWWLRCRGYRVLQYDFETPAAQVDLLVAERRSWGWSVVLCEVKTRRGAFVERSIKQAQMQRLWRAAQWLQGRCDRIFSDRRRSPSGARVAVRVDLVEVQLCGPRRLSFLRTKIRHLRGIVWEENDGVRW